MLIDGIEAPRSFSSHVVGLYRACLSDPEPRFAFLAVAGLSATETLTETHEASRWGPLGGGTLESLGPELVRQCSPADATPNICL